MPKRSTPAPVNRPDGVLNIAELETDDQIDFVWMRVSDAVSLQCEGNPKLHDIQRLALSFVEYGFQDPPKWDSNLNKGKGGIIYGNGRLEALAWLEQQHHKDSERYPRPRGISVVKESGEWAVQVKVGVYAKSETQAKQFLLDHNSLTLGGSDFDAADIARLYGADSYSKMLGDIRDGLEAEGLDIQGLTLTTTLDDLRFMEDDFDDDGVEYDEDGEPIDNSGPPSDASLLSLLDVTINEPRSYVRPHDVFRFSGRHVMVIAEVLTEWGLWVGFLKDDVLFAPYPGVFVPLSERAKDVDLIMVQPDTYIAGHIIDRYKDINGEDSVELISGDSDD